MNLVANFIQWDHWIFDKVNKTWTGEFGDWFFPLITNLINNTWFVRGVLPVLLIFWVYRQRKQAVKRILLVALLAGFCDSLSYRILKPYFQRPRPNHMAELNSQVRVPHRPASYSFPSNHSFTIFALAPLFSIFFVSIRSLFFVFAALIAYSRVYVGVHFPSDVFFSAFLGMGSFSLFYYLNFLYRSRWYKQRTVNG